MMGDGGKKITKGEEWGLRFGESVGRTQTAIPSGPFQFSLVQDRQRDSDGWRKGVNSPDTLSDKGKTGMKIIVINVSKV